MQVVLPVVAERIGPADRFHTRGGEPEVRFYWQARPTVLPVWWDGCLQVVRWGNRDRRDAVLPPTGWTWRESLAEGKWRTLSIVRGLQGLLVRDSGGRPTVFLVCEPATREYRIMTKAEWMPWELGR